VDKDIVIFLRTTKCKETAKAHQTSLCNRSATMQLFTFFHSLD